MTHCLVAINSSISIQRLKIDIYLFARILILNLMTHCLAARDEGMMLRTCWSENYSYDDFHDDKFDDDVDDQYDDNDKYGDGDTIVDDRVAAGEDVHVLHCIHRCNWRPPSKKLKIIKMMKIFWNYNIYYAITIHRCNWSPPSKILTIIKILMIFWNYNIDDAIATDRCNWRPPSKKFVIITMMMVMMMIMMAMIP